MSESYTTGGDTLQNCDKPRWAGQTFRPQETHILSFIDLEMRGPLHTPEPVIQVFHATADHKPTGDAVSRNRFTVETKSGFLTTGRARFSMSPFLLLEDNYYAIIVQNYPPLGGNTAYWQYDKNNATYPRGIRISSPDLGATWTKHYNDDHMFAEFGDPPLPTPDPPPPIENFAVLDLAKAHSINSVFVRLNTSVPCHLTLYWTDKKPLQHHTSRILRGLAVPWGTYFCFVAWHAIEQTESGDTMRHTFTIPDWSYCQTRWFTFRGEVDNIESPSVGPIFQQHHPGIETSTNRYVFQKAYYQCFRSARPGDPDLLYTEAHDQSDADSYYEPIIIYGQRIRVIGAYAAAQLRRLAFTFNTTIPAPIQLIKATLRLDIRKTSPPAGYQDKYDWHLKIRSGQDLNAGITHGDLSNYSKILALGTEVASKYADNLPPYGTQDYWYIDIPIQHINTEGLSVFTSLTSKDESSARPANNTVEEALFIHDSFSRLTLEYYQQ